MNGYHTARDTDLNSNDVIFKYKGENYSKNQYFFGETKQKEQKEVSTVCFLEFRPQMYRSVINPLLHGRFQTHMSKCSERE